MEISLRGRGFHLKGVIWQQDIQRLFLDKPISIETITGTFKNRMKVCFQFSFVELLHPSDEWLLTQTHSPFQKDMGNAFSTFLFLSYKRVSW